MKTGEGCKGKTGTEKEVGEARVYVLLMTKGAADINDDDVDVWQKFNEWVTKRGFCVQVRGNDEILGFDAGPDWGQLLWGL